jgi:hypothetical protein
VVADGHEVVAGYYDLVGPGPVLVGGQDHDSPSGEVLIGSGSDLDDSPNAFSPERCRQFGVHAVETTDQMQIGGVHGRRLEGNEQLVVAGVKVRLGD